MQPDHPQGTLESDVTVVVVPRERFSHTRAALESIYTNTDSPFRLIYVDGGSPAPIKRYLETQAKEKRFELIRTEDYLSPNQARNLGLQRTETKYVVFIDNDVEVARGWLAELVQCADENNAALVGPLYCIGQPLHEVIHMYGCEAGIREEQGKRHLYENQSYCNARLSEVRPELRIERCGLLEFHCLLARREVLNRLGPLDEALSTREHVDLCLAVQEAGGTVWVDPSAVVTYVPGAPFAWSDLPFYVLRWSDDWNQSSLRHFEKKWNLDAEDWERHHNWLRPHRQIPLRKFRSRLQRVLGARLGDRLVDSLEQHLAGKAQRHGKTHSPQTQTASSNSASRSA